MTRSKDRFQCRNWYPRVKKMHSVETLSENLLTPAGMLSADFESTDENCEFGEAIPMSSTSLKDKNGKLIYEGDILNVTHVEEETRIRIIAFNEVRLRFNLDTYYAKNSEIIGNIYENPELLNK